VTVTLKFANYWSCVKAYETYRKTCYRRYFLYYAYYIIKCCALRTIVICTAHSVYRTKRVLYELRNLKVRYPLTAFCRILFKVCFFSRFSKTVCRTETNNGFRKGACTCSMFFFKNSEFVRFHSVTRFVNKKKRVRFIQKYLISLQVGTVGT